MKFPSPEQEAAHQQAVIAGGAKGFFGGLAAALPASYVLQKRWPYYRTLPPSLKAFGIVTIVVPAFVIAAERAGLKYEKSQWDDIGKVELDTVKAREQARWDSLSTKDKFAEFAAHHHFSLVGGSWAASILGAYAWISRDPLATPLQKITQTRVWAQGLTLGVIVSAAILSHGRARKPVVDHSWRDVIEEEQREEEALKRQNPVRTA